MRTYAVPVKLTVPQRVILGHDDLGKIAKRDRHPCDCCPLGYFVVSFLAWFLGTDILGC